MKKGITCEVVAPSKKFYEVRSYFIGEIFAGIVGEYALLGNGKRTDYRVGGHLVALDAPAPVIATALNSGLMVGGVMADTNRQDSTAPSLKFVSPEFALVGGEWKRTGRATMAEIAVDKGGHTGTYADAFVTAVLSVRLTADGEFLKFQEKTPMRKSCGCVTREMGFVGTLDTLSPEVVIDLLFAGEQPLWSPAEMLANGSEFGREFADKLAVNPNVTQWTHAESRPENPRWRDTPAKGGKHQIF